MTERLDKLLAERTTLSRSEATTLCKRGHVTVDGKKIHKAATKVSLTAEIRFDGELVEPLPMFVRYHKPAGVHSTMRDEWGRPDLEGVLPEAWQGKLHPVGRLDAETTGLLMFCKDGTLTQRLLHPKRGVEREYIAEVEHEIDVNALTQALETGVETAAGIVTAQVVNASGHTVQVIVTEGKHRMVRRMLANAGYPVEKLHRVRYGEFRVDGLAEGEVEAVEEGDWAWVTS